MTGEWPEVEIATFNENLLPELCSNTHHGSLRRPNLFITVHCLLHAPVTRHCRRTQNHYNDYNVREMKNSTFPLTGRSVPQVIVIIIVYLPASARNVVQIMR